MTALLVVLVAVALEWLMQAVFNAPSRGYDFLGPLVFPLAFVYALIQAMLFGAAGGLARQLMYPVAAQVELDRCARCGYDLRGIDNRPFPECGETSGSHP